MWPPLEPGRRSTYDLGMGIGAHFWTFWPLLSHRRKPQTAPPSQPLLDEVEDPVRGRVPLQGCLTTADPERLLVFVHGLGGCTESLYMLRAARHAQQLFGVSSLRVNMRGADRRGADIYHAGLTQDLHGLLAHPDLAGFKHIYILGFSVGGHVVLRYATDGPDPRVRSVAAVCAPLDLAATVEDFDRLANWPYRRYILSGLKELYGAVARYHELPVPLGEVLAVTTLRQWDSLTVVPRFGFQSVDDYYGQASVCTRLEHLKVPALLVAAEGDPMVTSRSIRRGLRRAPAHPLEVRWLDRGGHVGFPAALDLGVDVPQGLDAQVQGWMLQQGDGSLV